MIYYGQVNDALVPTSQQYCHCGWGALTFANDSI